MTMAASTLTMHRWASVAAGVGIITYTVTGIAFARHATRVVFNRQLTSFTTVIGLLRVTRPLQIAWRLATARLRCTPRLYILGEVRCGTTTLASLLRARLGLHGPFTPWDHPLANEKESFFFSGHYFGLVSPRMYSMCFPLRLVSWFHRRVLARPIVSFDACASYLSSPWLPPLLRRTLCLAHPSSPLPVLVVCLREPVSQHVSWWRLEQGGMAWGTSMGMGASWLGPPSRLERYPPATLREAVDLSRSEAVEEMWRKAAELPLTRPERPADGGGDDNVDGGAFLPEWAMPFPNGQLSAFDSMGRYADSIERWLAVFPRECFVFTTVDEIGSDPAAVLTRIVERCEALGVELPAAPPPPPHRHSHGALAAASASAPCGAWGAPPPRLNESAPIDRALEPDTATLLELGAYYKPHNERLFQLLGVNLGWHRDERFFWYR